MEPAAFIAELRLRMGLSDAVADSWCPRCDGIMDAHSHHAAVCSAGGERTQRHNAIRDLLCLWTERAGLHPEKERPGLLLPLRPDDARVARRRPADIYLPCLDGTPTALDLAVTGPQRPESLSQAAQIPVSAAAAYAQVKRDHQDTEQLCARQGVRFLPLVSESTGAWDMTASRTLRVIASSVAAREGLDGATAYAAMLQELSVVTRGFMTQPQVRASAVLLEASPDAT